MTLSADVVFDIVSASVCAALILVRCGYRLLSRCKTHVSCHRTWHVDDAYMAFALVPLIVRTVCITISFVLNPNHKHGDITEADAEARRLTVAQLEDNYITSYKLLIVGRISYALFLWCLKLCLLSFYSRFVHVFRWGLGATRALWWSIIVSFVITMIVTLTECRPLHRMWELEPHHCQKAFANFITMAIFNILTDVALIIFPFPILRYVKVEGKAKIPLVFLFCLGGFLVVITLVRMPLILDDQLSQRSRSLWASIEILGACIVANTAFYYAFLKEIQRGHDPRAASNSVGRMDFNLPSEPSIHLRNPGSESHEFDSFARHSSMSVYASSVGNSREGPGDKKPVIPRESTHTPTV